MPPMLVRHGILRDLTAQFDMWFQDGSGLSDLPENEKVSANLRTGTRSVTLPVGSSQRNDISYEKEQGEWSGVPSQFQVGLPKLRP